MELVSSGTVLGYVGHAGEVNLSYLDLHAVACVVGK
jgi:hypothetical protein